MPQRPASPPASLDQWVIQGEDGTDGAVQPRGEQTAGKLARLTIDLPADLHAKFKATCALRGTRMINEVRQFIEEWTQKNG